MPQLFFGSRVWGICTWKWGAGSQVHKASWNAQVIARGSHVLHAPGLVGTDGQGLDTAAPPSRAPLPVCFRVCVCVGGS